MKISEALSLGRRKLTGSPSATLDSRLLLEHVMAVNQSYLIAHDQEELTHEQESQFITLLAGAGMGQPIPYLIGSAPFLGFNVKVSPAVLIPRPETERLVEGATEWVAGRFGRLGMPRIVDVGTGSGCIALALAMAFPAARIAATDISAAALEVAKGNAYCLNLSDRIDFHLGAFLNPIVESPDLIVANLPYIADHEWTSLDVGVKWYEPDVALRGGSDGLDGIRQLLAEARARLTRGGALFLEIGWQQGRAASSLAQSAFPSAQVDVRPDYVGNDRIVSILTGDVRGDR